MPEKINQIICGDTTLILENFTEDCLDLIVTSPPYGNIRQSKHYNPDFNFKKIAWHLKRCLKDGGVLCWNVGDQTINGSETGTPLRQALYFMDQIKLKLWDTMIFAKNSFSFPSKDRYHQVFEFVFVFSKGRPKTFNPIKDRKNKYKGTRGASGRNKDGSRNKGTSSVRNEWGLRFNIWEYTIGGGHSCRDKFGHEHPAIMHYKLAHDLIRSWSNPGDVVLDPFCGGGTTCIEALLLDRNYIGIDLSQKYCDLSKKRIAIYD